MLNLSEFDRHRIIEADWADTEADEKYLAEVSIYANNRNGLLADISRVLTERNISILRVNTRNSKQGLATLDVAFEVGGKEELTRVVDQIRRIESVVDIERV